MAHISDFDIKLNDFSKAHSRLKDIFDKFLTNIKSLNQEGFNVEGITFNDENSSNEFNLSFIGRDYKLSFESIFLNNVPKGIIRFSLIKSDNSEKEIENIQYDIMGNVDSFAEFSNVDSLLLTNDLDCISLVLHFLLKEINESDIYVG